MGTLQTAILGLNVEQLPFVTEIVIETDDHAELVNKW
jgi:hypothetical protein